jgi:hypothetical protein
VEREEMAYKILVGALMKRDLLEGLIGIKKIDLAEM